MNRYEELKKLGIGTTDLKNVQLTLTKLMSIGAVDLNMSVLDIVKVTTILIDEINSGVVDRNREIELKNK